MGDFAQFNRQLGATMKLTQFAVDDGPHVFLRKKMGGRGPWRT
jgi:hypothetical protein